MAGWLRNEMDYLVRSMIRLRRGPAQLPAEGKDGLFSAEGEREARRLVELYRLEGWSEVSGRTDFAASLFYAAMIEAALRGAAVRLPDRLVALDAGAGDWFYVRPLLGLLRRYERPREVQLDGVELDAWALYKGFRSRHDWAEAYVGGERDARYIAADLLTYQRPVDLGLILFPFMFEEDLQRWGLPRRHLRPMEYLRHVWGRVRPGGVLVVANMGEAERERQHGLMAEAGIPVSWSSAFESPLYAYEQVRYVTVAQR